MREGRLEEIIERENEVFVERQGGASWRPQERVMGRASGQRYISCGQEEPGQGGGSQREMEGWKERARNQRKGKEKERKKISQKEMNE